MNLRHHAVAMCMPDMIELSLLMTCFTCHCHSVTVMSLSFTLPSPILSAQALPSAEDLFGSLQPASHVSSVSPLSLGTMQVDWGLSLCEREKASGKERARALFGSLQPASHAPHTFRKRATDDRAISAKEPLIIEFCCGKWLLLHAAHTSPLSLQALLQKEPYHQWLFCRKSPIINGSFAERDLSPVALLQKEPYHQWLFCRKSPIISGSFAERLWGLRYAGSCVFVYVCERKGEWE